jgi:hypothetical protein
MSILQAAGRFTGSLPGRLHRIVCGIQHFRDSVH